MKLKDVKNWGPEIEKPINDEWKKAEKYLFDKKSKKKIYSIDTPPPYVNSPIHIGQAVTYCYMDFFARYRRMKGFQVIFPLGLDRNGLPIEVAAEKEFSVSPFQVSREKFIEYCKKILEKTSSETEDTFARLGISFTSYKKGNHIGSAYFTDSEDYRRVTQATFIDLFKKGLVYEDSRINNWDPKLRTTIADSEIEYKEIPSDFNFIKWIVKETKEEIIVATTRPELICTCGMVIFNPGDKRYESLDGKTAITPIFNKEVKIKAHSLADIEKGTGLAMMCSAGDLSDIQFFREQRLKPLIAINTDGTMNEHAGILMGLKVKEARNKIIELLKEKDLIIKQDHINHRTPVSERSGFEIEFIEMPEFYLKQIEFKEEIKKIAKKIKFYPLESRKLLFDWIDSLKIDWPISRRRFYATPIPLWHSEDGKKVAISDGKEYCEPWKEKPKENFEVYMEGKKIGKVKDFKVKWVGEERVFDTWMDSSISELVLLKYKEDDVFFKRAYPVSLRPQGKEIVRTWLYYTLLRGFLETKRPCFQDVWIHQHIVDSKGYKMSKSKGNKIDPQELLSKYGGEAIRLWSAIEGDLSKQDLKCSEEKINAELKTINKILNVSKFVLLFDKPKSKPKLTNTDQLFVDYLDQLTLEIDKSYMDYDFYHPAIKLRGFLWDIFASNYLELIKARAYNQDKKFSEEESRSAKYTLYYLLEGFLTLVYPIIPKVTTIIGADLGIEFKEFPKIKGKFNTRLIDKLVEFNSMVWKKKKDQGLSLREGIKDIKIPKELRSFEKDLRATHNLI
jgi:valyl-tRNA synthetase